MMCDPCFMDANQVGFVHELPWEDIKTVLDNAISIKPKRQMSVQFSGGEPTMSPYFLDAVRYSRKVGYNSVQAATNGIEFAKSLDLLVPQRTRVCDTPTFSSMESVMRPILIGLLVICLM